MAGSSGTTARNSATVAVWTLVSRVTGLLRVVVVGAALGATYFANSFQATNVVPNIVFSLITGPVLTMVLIPALIGALERGGPDGARQLLATVGRWLVLVAAAVAGVLVVAAPALAWTLSRGIPDPAQQQHGWWLTTLLLVLVAPQIVLYCLVHLGISAQRAQGRFALSAAAPAVENVVLIGVVAAAGWWYGYGLDVADVPVGLVIVLGLGSTLAVGLHAALQLFGAARVGLPAWPSLRRRGDSHSAEVIVRLRRSVGVAALPSLAMYVLIAIASSVPGGVFVVQMSYSVQFSMSYLSSRAVSMASLPELADARADTSAFATIWRRGLAYALIAGLPLAVLLAVLAAPTAGLLAAGELRGTALVGSLAGCLVLVAVSQLVTGLSDLGNQALYARLEDQVPRIASRVTLGVTAVVGLTALLAPAGGARLVWLVAAVLAGELCAAALVLGRIRRVIRPERFVDRRALAGTVFAALVMIPVVAGTWWAQHAYPGGQLATVLVLAVGCGAAVAAYALVLRGTWRAI
ncbi:lipid II flippase MurJ [Pseudonocardia spinosispora]|uniref:lipid II flippase MurJ n=1 Tax=Pseudonocardia spinosispora TaxID=103441 RepID=UPI00041DBBAD|nr:lipid II flippase MurJ [Pseudonocardia spinosispora]